jgi:hypothetical protein
MCYISDSGTINGISIRVQTRKKGHIRGKYTRRNGIRRRGNYIRTRSRRREKLPKLSPGATQRVKIGTLTSRMNG